MARSEASHHAPRVEHEFLADATPPPPEEASEMRDESLLKDYVADWMGTPHRMGGMSKDGVDCSGFVICVYRDVYADPFSNRRSRDLLAETEKIDQSELKEGDLVFFKINSRQINHVGVYLSEGYFAHASLSSGLTVSNLGEAYYSKYFYCGGRKK